MKQKINKNLIQIAILAILATTIGITFAYYGLFQKQVKDDLELSAELLKESHYFENKDVDFSINNKELRVTWVDSDGTVLYDNDKEAESLPNHKNRPEIKEAFETGIGESIRNSDTMNMNTFYYAVLLDNGTVLRVAREANSIYSVFITALPTELLVVLLILTLCVLFSNFLTRQLIAPIEEMGKNISNSNSKPPYPELNPFFELIRSQHDDILSSAKIRQDFTANVSHELKTPLTAISGYAELIENDLANEEQKIHFAKEIHKNSVRLLSLIDDTIKLSQLDQMEIEGTFEQFDLYELAGNCVNHLKINAQKRNITLFFEGEKSLVLANKELIQEVIENLIENAIRYNNENGKVWVSVSPLQGNVILSVKDNGIGISNEEQERIFERFYRVDKSRSKATGGTGLGLSIVKHIVELHHATIELNSNPGIGTVVKVIL